MCLKMGRFLNMLKENKKLFYTVNVLIILVILSFILRLDFDNNRLSEAIPIKDSLKDNSKDYAYDNYINGLETRLEDIIHKINGVNSVKAMIYTKYSPKLEPIFDENINSESNIETGTNGIKTETKRDNIQRQVITSNNQVIEKYYEYPEITGVLIVVGYNGNKNIYKILTDSVRTLLDVKINNIEVIVTN